MANWNPSVRARASLSAIEAPAVVAVTCNTTAVITLQKTRMKIIKLLTGHATHGCKIWLYWGISCSNVDRISSWNFCFFFLFLAQITKVDQGRSFGPCIVFAEFSLSWDILLWLLFWLLCLWFLFWCCKWIRAWLSSCLAEIESVLCLLLRLLIHKATWLLAKWRCLGTKNVWLWLRLESRLEWLLSLLLLRLEWLRRLLSWLVQVQAREHTSRCLRLSSSCLRYHVE